MLPLIPIVVGVTGKRDLKGREEYVRQRLVEALVDLERRFPNSPLVLATGLAKGADLLATEVALSLPSKRWTVVGVLPFARHLFLEDFKSEEDAGWRQTLQNLLDKENPRFMTKVLKPLLKAPKKPFEEADLHRNGDNPDRRRHYEQVGLVIADRCGLLIAVMPNGEQPGKVGGTARIAKHKRDGKLDAEAAAVARDSQEIAPPEPLDCEIKGLVQIIDPDGAEPSTAPTENEQRYAWMLLEQIEEFNDIVRRREPASARVLDAWQLLDAADEDAAGGYLSRLRRELSGFQGRAKDRLTRSMWRLAALFVVSVAILETFAKVYPEVRLLFLGYSVVVLAGLFLFHRVRKNELQAFTEDYRGGAEAMRVQVEWWRLGLRGPMHRVDRHYLVGGEGHFAVLRSGIKAAIDAAVLLGPDAAPPGRPLELQPEKKGLRRRDFWIPGQIDFFKDRSDRRHRTAIPLSSLAWYLFQLSVGVGLAIGALMLLLEWGALAPAQRWVLALTKDHRQWLPTFIFASAVLWAVLFLLLVRAPQQGPLRKDATLWEWVRYRLWYRSLLGTRGRHSGRHGWTLALLFGALIVPGVLALVLDQGYEGVKALGKTEKISLVLMIVLASSSGAVRFVLERRVLEAEAVSYREALQKFRTAEERALEVRSNAGSGAGAEATILEADQKLGLELGRVALAENEAWLRAHRQRPFEPVG